MLETFYIMQSQGTVFIEYISFCVQLVYCGCLEQCDYFVFADNTHHVHK